MSNKVEMDVLNTHTIFATQEPPRKAGIEIEAKSVWDGEKSFKRGQMLFKIIGGDQFRYGEVISNYDRDLSLKFLGICVNDITVQEGITMADVYTDGRFIGKLLYDLQETRTQQHLWDYATQHGYASPYSMIYEKTISFETSH